MLTEVFFHGTALRAPLSYAQSTLAERTRHCNGMGPSGLGFLVPDTFWGLDMAICGDIHDWCYTFGHQDGLTREQADEMFLDNMRTYVIANSNWLTRRLRLRRAKTYHYFVTTGGAKHWRSQ